MAKLIALRPVLYRGRFYQRGDVLPVQDTVMTAAWLRAGSAAWAEPTPPAPRDVPEPSQEKPRRKRS